MSGLNHLALVSTSFPDEAFQPGQEAAGTFVSDFAATLSRYVQVSVVAPGGQTSRQRHGNLTIHRFAVPSLPLSLLKPTQPHTWPAIVQTLRAGQHALDELIAHQNIDHVFALWALPSGYWARRVWQQHQIPYSIWALGSDIWSLGKIPGIKQILQQVLRDSRFRFADGFILSEDVTALSNRDCYFLPSSRQLALPQAKVYTKHAPYKLAFLGRWHPHKGVDLLLDSLGMLDEESWTRIAEVRIFGGGPLEETVHAGCEALQHAGRPVVQGGYLDRADATNLLLWADYLLLPSRIESIPVIFSDALQCGCPLISTPIGDLPRLLREYKVGVLAAKTSAAAFSQAIRAALETEPTKFSKAITQTQAIFDVENAAGQLLEVLGNQI